MACVDAVRRAVLPAVNPQLPQTLPEVLVPKLTLRFALHYWKAKNAFSANRVVRYKEHSGVCRGSATAASALQTC